MEPTPIEELRALVHQARALAEVHRSMGAELTYKPLASALSPPRREREPAPSAASPSPVPVDPALEARRRENAPRLEELARSMQGCTLCRLSEGRTHLVFGQGDAAAELVFVGEGPGQTEDETGLAFVGRAGELLTKMIEAMGLTRAEVFIANLVKCRPPGNRPPAPDEMATCLPFLEKQLDVIRPKAICALGKTAAVGLGLIKPSDALGRVRGRFLEWRGIPVMVTFHPAYLLRTPGDKKKAWEDLQKLFPYLTRRRA